MNQKILLFGPVLDQFWGPFWGQKLLQKGTKNGTSFRAALRRLSGVSPLRFQELYERCAKAIGIGIILSKRKGGIYIERPTLFFLGSRPCAWAGRSPGQAARLGWPPARAGRRLGLAARSGRPLGLDAHWGWPPARARCSLGPAAWAGHSLGLAARPRRLFGPAARSGRPLDRTGRSG